MHDRIVLSKPLRTLTDTELAVVMGGCGGDLEPPVDNGIGTSPSVNGIGTSPSTNGIGTSPSTPKPQ